jgi:hypothetical protein
MRLMEQRGLGPQADPEEADALRRDEPLLADLYGASISGRVATGPRAGKRIDECEPSCVCCQYRRW